MGDKIIGSTFVLILLFLVINNASAGNNILNALTNGLTYDISALQGKAVT